MLKQMTKEQMTTYIIDMANYCTNGKLWTEQEKKERIRFIVNHNTKEEIEQKYNEVVKDNLVSTAYYSYKYLIH